MAVGFRRWHGSGARPDRVNRLRILLRTLRAEERAGAFTRRHIRPCQGNVSPVEVAAGKAALSPKNAPEARRAILFRETFAERCLPFSHGRLIPCQALPGLLADDAGQGGKGG